MALEGLIDTNVLSLALRRKPEQLSSFEAAVVATLRIVMVNDEGGLIGPVRQEILIGIRQQKQFEKVRLALAGLLDVDLEALDFEFAAELTNILLSRGVITEDTDVLLASAAIRRRIWVLTLDHDLLNFAPFGLKLLAIYREH